MPHKGSPVPDQLQQLSRQLEEWRNAHAPRSRLPEELWAAAVELGRQHGLFRTAHTLRLDYTNLKKRVQTAPGLRATAPAAFVELVAPAPVTGECTVEVGIGARETASGDQGHDLTGRDEPDSHLDGGNMIQIPAQMKILVAVEPVDLRKGIDGLAAVCREKLERDPFSGCLFVFRSRRATAIKLLCYDGQGFWVAQKRLSKGRFVWWPEGSTMRSLEAHQAQLLLAAGNPETSAAPVWRKVN